MPGFHLGDPANCKQCGASFPRLHGRHKFCTSTCAATHKNKMRKPTYRPDYYRKYYEKKRAHLRQTSKTYYEEHKAKIAEKNRVYRRSLPREVVLERRARWYEAHKVRAKQRYHATRTWLPWLNALRGSKQRAVKHNIPFTLTKEWAEARWTGRCEVTNIEFVLSDKRSPYLFSPSLDRIIPTLGYTPENSRFVLHAVNALKGQGTDEDMLRIAKAIIEHQKELFPILYAIAPDEDFAETRL
jgi:hypothetical protein